MSLSKEELTRALSILKELLSQAETDISEVDDDILEPLETTVDTLSSPLFNALVDIQQKYEVTLQSDSTQYQDETPPIVNPENIYPVNITDNNTPSVTHLSHDPPSQDILAIEITSELELEPDLNNVGVVSSPQPINVSTLSLGYLEEDSEPQITSPHSDLLYPMRDQTSLTEIKQAFQGRQSREVRLKQTTESLGMDIVGLSRTGLFINDLSLGSPAERCGLLQVGDQLFEVNGKSCVNMANFEAIYYIEEVPVDNEIVLTVQYNPTGGAEWTTISLTTASSKDHMSPL